MSVHTSPPTTELFATEAAPASARVWPHLATWIVLGVAAMCGASVFFLFDALPFQDLPAHAGLIAVRHRFEASPFEAEYFVYAPHVGPYSLFRFLGEILMRVSSPLTAVRVLGVLPVLAIPAALIWMRARLHGEISAAYGLLALTLSFGLMTLLGFASYQLGIALMLVALTAWLELLADVDAGRPTLRREIIVGALGIFVFVGHGHAFILFLLLAGISTIVTGERLRRLWRLRALAPSILVASWVAWIERSGTIPAGSAPVRDHHLLPHFQGATDKLSLLITPTLMTRTGIDAFVGLVIWGLTIGAAIATFRYARIGDSVRGDSMIPKRHSEALLAGAAVIGILFLVLPHSVGWFGFVDGRLVPVFLLLALGAVRPPALGRTLRPLFARSAPLLAAVQIGLVLYASHRFQDEAAGYKETLAEVPAKSRLLNLPVNGDSAIFTAHPFIHYDKLVMADRPVVVSDLWFHQGSALYPTAANPVLALPDSYSESNLQILDWPAYRLGDWDYVLIRTEPGAPAPRVPSALELARQSGGWRLYRVRESARRARFAPAPSTG